MSVDTALGAGRLAAEARMTSRCTIRRKDDDTDQDEDTGVEAPLWQVLYTDHPFRLGGTYRGDSPTRRVEVGGVEIQLAVRVGHLPVDTDALADGDLIEVTGGENEGAVYKIVEAEWQDQATARRVPLLAVDRPEEWL